MKLCFVSGSDRAGAWKSRGEQISRAFLKEGHIADTVFVSQLTDKTTKLYDFIIFIKCDFPKNIRKSNDCKFILDIVDNFGLLRAPKLNRFDAVIFPNQKSFDDYRTSISCKSCWIPHHWDPTFEKPTVVFDQPMMIYVGRNTQYPKFLKGDKRIKIVFNNYSEVPNIISNYNIHVNLRMPNTTEYNYKPNSKLSFCASCESLIICMREPNVTQFQCMKDYPFFVDEYTHESFNRCIKKIEAAIKLKNEDWNKATSCMQIIKEQTELSTIIEQYEVFLRGI